MFSYLKIKNKNRQRGKGKIWWSRINGVTGIGTSTGVIKWKISIIECGLKFENAKAYGH